MIFASDLDRTLIYSKRFLHMYNTDIDNSFYLIERSNTENHSYISCRSIKLLMEISNLINFIPITTRSLDQYNRIDLKKIGLNPQYVVIANGGIILENGIPDPYWTNYIKSELENYISIDNLINKLHYFLCSEYVKKFVICENMFLYIILNSSIDLPLDLINSISNFCDTINFSFSFQGNKLYLIPNIVSKGNALTYLKSKLESTFVISSGDSNLDFSMFETSNLSILPNHHSINNNLDNIYEHIILTNNRGIIAGEEILDLVYLKIKETLALI